MNSGKNVLIVGVGGQGVLLASEILSSVAVEAGYDAKKSEVHGMSQRGGVVSSHIRFGKKVYSPLINEGDADVILAFEEAEALRWIHFLKDDGVVIVNEYKLVPPIVVTEKLKYPDDPLKTISKSVSKLISIDAGSEAENLGNPRLVNTILLGILSTTLPIKEEIWIDVIRKRVPKGTEELNVKAFKKGREFK
ncbi:indolepyruvate oxidoreductase subunit beta [candidate division KSB1 bacterium]|nr:MAG: indolepyruvate oxidoreductase subunit beta [candidate division KSB1 bacterium]